MKSYIINKIQNLIENQALDEKELLFQLKGVLYEGESQIQLPKESRSIVDVVSENLIMLESETYKANIIKTGFNSFETLFGGFALGEFIVIGGRPAMGKTQLLINLSLNISVETPVLYFTFDLSESLLANRFISSLSGIEINKILQQEFTDEEKGKLASMGNLMSQYKIFVNDSFNNSISALRAHCQKQIENHGVKVIIVDYLQMMSSLKYRHNRENEMSYISRELKSIAKDFNVCVIASSQLSRAVESRPIKLPQLSDLRESGAIEQDADKVIFLYRHEYYGIACDENGESTEGITDVILAKNKRGGVGNAKLLRDAHFTNFTDFIRTSRTFSFLKSRIDEIEDPF